MSPQRARPQVDSAVADVQYVRVGVEVLMIRRDTRVPRARWIIAPIAADDSLRSASLNSLLRSSLSIFCDRRSNIDCATCFAVSVTDRVVSVDDPLTVRGRRSTCPTR